jgi:hypothetical protein
MSEPVSKVTVLAKSSEGGPYAVEFSVLGNMALIKGDSKMLFDAAQTATLAQIRAWPQFVSTQKRLAEYEAALFEIVRELEGVKSRERSLKKEIADFLTTGK